MIMMTIVIKSMLIDQVKFDFSVFNIESGTFLLKTGFKLNFNHDFNTFYQKIMPSVMDVAA